MEIKKRTVKTFDEFSSCIKEFEQNSNRCNHSFDMMAFYRGHSNEEYVCQPTVFRNILGREDNMLHTAVASGRWCGGQWPQCGLSGHHESAH